MSKEKESITNILNQAGVFINGKNPWDIQVHNENFYQRVISQGSLGLGEAYMDGWWDCGSLDEFIFRILRNGLKKELINWRLVLYYAKAAVVNFQSKSRAWKVGEKHYDAGNDLYQHMLGRTMVYTCGYWQNAKNLDQAQEAKLDLVCHKIGLKAGMKILDIGCGWGSFMKFAVKNYGVSAVGLTISKKQISLGQELCVGLPIEFQLKDYRDAKGSYDRVVSLGMLEHVGHKNYNIFMKTAHSCLKDDGLFLLHTIGSNKSVTAAEPWINKYIFPGGLLPSLTQLSKAMEGRFVVEDLHNFGADYDKTLMAWFQNFKTSWPEIKHDYDERFYRMWSYYLLACASMFRARNAQLWQMVLSKDGILGGYNSIR